MEEFCQNITISLLHSFWLAGIATLLLLLAMRIIDQHRSILRYTLSVLALLTVAVSIIFTYNVVSITRANQSEIDQKDHAQQQVTQLDKTMSGNARPEHIAGTTPSQSSDEASFPVTSSSATTGSSSSERSISPAISEAQPFAIPKHILTGVFWFWVVGCLLMYYRIFRSLVGLRRFSLSYKPLDPGPLEDLIRETASQIGMARHFEIFLAQTAVPSTIGFFRPILLLPLSMATGYTDDDLRCIIAHELVHIRHYDCLINFVQLLIEGVLFFNPAIWLISRQIRLERELCCDQVALRYSESRIDYVKLICSFIPLGSTLASISRNSATLAVCAGESLAMSLGKSSEDHEWFLRRVRRLALPKDRAKLRMPWSSVLLVLFATVVLMTAISMGVDPSARFVANLLSPKERVEAIEQLEEKYGQADYQKCPKEEWPIISGTIRTEDGSPLPKQIEGLYHSENVQLSTTCAVEGRYARSNREQTTDTADPTLPNAKPINRIDDSGFFSYAVQPGVVTLAFQAKGYALVATKTEKLKPNQRLDKVELVLTKGFDSKILIIDSKGNPIEDAKLNGGFSPIMGSCQMLYNETSDKDGIITISHSPTGMWFQFNIVADGYEPISDSFASSERKGATALHQVTMQKGVSFAGRVLNKQGEPVAGAEFKLLASTHGYANREKVYDTTDTNGCFAITQLKSGSEYLFLVRSKDYGCQLYKYTHPNPDKIDITMKQEKIIGRVTGNLDLLKRKDGTPVLEYRWSQRLKGYEDCSGNPHFVPVRIEGEQGRFEISELIGNQISIYDPTGFSDFLLKGPVEQFVEHEVVVDLKQTDTADVAMRKVIINFVPPKGSPPAEGTVSLTVPERRGIQYLKKHYITKSFPVKNGRVELEMPTPGYNLHFNNDDTNLAGYTIPSSETKCFFPWLEIPAGDSPLEFHIKLEPAGMIYGRVFNKNASTQSGSVTCKMVKKPEGMEFWNQDVSSQSILPDRKDGADFALNGIPLGGEYYVIASTNSWHAFIVSQKITLDPSNPIQKVDLTIPKCDATIRATIKDKQGNPLSLPISVQFDLDKKYGGGGYCFGTPPYSKPDGEFQFEVASNPPGKYTLEINPKKDFRPQRIEVNRFDRPISIVMQPGQVVDGILLDSKQQPIPGAKLRAYYTGQPFEQCHAESATDAEGRFRFSNLKEGRQYNLSTDGVYSQLSPSNFTAIGNKEIHIIASP